VVLPRPPGGGSRLSDGRGAAGARAGCARARTLPAVKHQANHQTEQQRGQANHHHDDGYRATSGRSIVSRLHHARSLP
jgi:hypothetical protein